MVELDEATLERVRREKAELGGALEDSAARRLWKGPFLMPAEGRISSSFGLRRILNGKPRSPHTGLDIGAPAGRAVRASNSGTVTLTGERYFSGLTVVIDHGLGLSTMYFHLSEVLVKEGERVERGQIIGRVGSTGRSTGPHLHWGVWLSGARVDPRSLMAATGAAAETGKTLEAAAEKPGATSPAATGPAGQPDR
ncbi:MAG TPA: M23 family metallopeptidase [Deltaproteobacteria bacterium]|nr:M23 family metallopeptidase [Deltaproteobacteria bacterium]